MEKVLSLSRCDTEECVQFAGALENTQRGEALPMQQLRQAVLAFGLLLVAHDVEEVPRGQSQEVAAGLDQRR